MKAEPILTNSLTLDKSENYNLINDVISRLSDNINKQFDGYIIEGLKRKGFEFSNRHETEQFLRERCTCIDSLEYQEKVYSVDNIPFLLHKYKTEMIMPSMIDNNEGFSMIADMGTYAYL